MRINDHLLLLFFVLLKLINNRNVCESKSKHLSNRACNLIANNFVKLKTKTRAITMSALLSRRKKKTKTQQVDKEASGLTIPKVIDESDSYEEIGSPISTVVPMSLESSQQSIASNTELNLINNSNDSIESNVNESLKGSQQYISSSLARANYVR